MKVPFLDLKAQYVPIKEEIATAIQAVLDHTAFAGGPFVAEFEKNFADYCQSDTAIAVNSGTMALWLTLTAMDIGPGDEVITVPNTFIATAEAVSLCGAKPVFVDVDESTCLMNPDLIEAAITPRTRAIIPVHLYGQMADMEAILQIAKRNNLLVVEDACQAHGATQNGKKAGSLGDAGCFSFYPGKNLGAYGEGGAITTNNSGLAQKIKMLRDHGQSQKYHHDFVGCNGRMDGFQGAILDVKLKHLPAWTEKRRDHAAQYAQLLSDIPEIILPTEADGNQHVYHVFQIQVRKRDQLLQFLKDRDIFCGIHYPIPLHLTGAYKDLNLGEGSFPVTEKTAMETLSLPMYPELENEHIRQVSSSIHDFFTK